MIYALELKRLPFKLDKHDILYIENRRDDELNAYIGEHYDAICKCFSERGYRFIYMPFHLVELFEEDVIRYYAPYTSGNIENPYLDSDWILEYMVHPENRGKIKPSLVFSPQNDEYRGIQIKDYDYAEDGDFSQLLGIIENEYSHNSIRFRRKREYASDMSSSLLASEAIPEPADETFSWESRQLIHEVEEKIAKLKRMGISAAILEKLVHKEEKLSRLLITKDYGIFLPDYQNLEIKMTPLPKAVFLLFLHHPEGIVFKHLPNYREELEEIYGNLKDSFGNDATRRSLDNLTDPFNNSINEKCARIREAFVSQFDEHLSRYYYVDGKRGEAKKILLPRELVTWE